MKKKKTRVIIKHPCDLIEYIYKSLEFLQTIFIAEYSERIIVQDDIM